MFDFFFEILSTLLWLFVKLLKFRFQKYFFIRTLAIGGLIFVALGAGGIRACDVVIGADQFQLPQQQTQMDTFFSNFYICVNIASLLAYIVAPLLRNWSCLSNNDSCYVLVFGTAGAALFIAIGKVLGRRLCTNKI